MVRIVSDAAQREKQKLKKVRLTERLANIFGKKIST
jgi:hypothetical protein